jgi:DNA-binding MarR family transcriptional regulator
MMALWEEDKITISELIERTAIDGSALTQILKKMVEKSLLEVSKDQQDKRKRFIELSIKGQKLKQQAATIPSKIHCQFNSLDATKAKQLMQALDLVIHDLNK